MANISTVPIDARLIAEAESFGLNVAQEAELHLRSHIAKRAREGDWCKLNCDAIQAWNAWIDENGIPFEELRPW